LALAETITSLPWTVKPLYGFITDSFPIWGMRRRPYLILAGLLGECAVGTFTEGGGSPVMRGGSVSVCLKGKYVEKALSDTGGTAE
jgi:hypothetical protein